ncbi:MAG: TIGR03905 family TSCPD domain-containing protein [Cellulosilyticaceae bacterium]
MENFKTKGVCSTEILFDIQDGIIKEASFVNGCPGNTLGVTTLIQGMKVEEAIKRLKGIDCRGRGTSCPDQLAIAFEKYIQEQTK